MKVLFINPPKTRVHGTGFISALVDLGIPLGTLQLASWLEKNKQKVAVIDCAGDPKAVPQRIDNNKIRFGITAEDLMQRIKKFSPDLVGISGQFIAQQDDVLWVSKIVKEISPKVPVVVGGSVIYPEIYDVLKRESTLDICAFGEGEETLLELVKWVRGEIKLKDIKGIIYKNKGKVIKNEKRQWIFDIEKIPMPAYHLIDMNHYLELPKKGFFYRLKDTKRSISLITSRGCPENCCFCAVHYVSGKPWRAFSAEYVLDHIELLVRKYGVEQIHIEDDSFTLDMNRAHKIMDGIIERGLKFQWDTLNGVRADKLDESLIRKMKAAGCTRLCIAPEVGSQRVLDEIIDKRMSLKDVVEVSRICKDVGMPLQAFFMIGLPGETRQELRQTVDFAKMLMRKYNVIVATVLRATPYYGTRMYEEAKAKGYLKKDPTPDDFASSLSGSNIIIETEEFNKEYLDRLSKELIRASCVYSAVRYLKQPLKLLRRFRNPYLIKTAVMRFIKGSDITA